MHCTRVVAFGLAGFTEEWSLSEVRQSRTQSKDPMPVSGVTGSERFSAIVLSKPRLFVKRVICIRSLEIAKSKGPAFCSTSACLRLSDARLTRPAPSPLKTSRTAGTPDSPPHPESENQSSRWISRPIARDIAGPSQARRVARPRHAQCRLSRLSHAPPQIEA